MVINFECQKCRTLFDCDIGTVTFSENSDQPDFEKEIICPKCGSFSMDEVLLTEIGQSQLTEITLGYDSDEIFDFEDDELNGFGLYEVNILGVFQAGLTYFTVKYFNTAFLGVTAFSLDPKLCNSLINDY